MHAFKVFTFENSILNCNVFKVRNISLSQILEWHSNSNHKLNYLQMIFSKKIEEGKCKQGKHCFCIYKFLCKSSVKDQKFYVTLLNYFLSSFLTENGTLSFAAIFLQIKPGVKLLSLEELSMQELTDRRAIIFINAKPQEE